MSVSVGWRVFSLPHSRAGIVTLLCLKSKLLVHQKATEGLPRFQPPDKETERLCPIKAFSTSLQGIQVSHGSVRWVLSHPTLSPAPQERLGREQRRKYICDPLQMLQNSTHGLCSLHLSRLFFKGGGFIILGLELLSVSVMAFLFA